MINRKRLVQIIGLLGLVSYISISIAFITLLLVLLFIPPALVLVTVSREGAPIIIKELKSLLAKGEEFFVISISRESIILEPQFR